MSWEQVRAAILQLNFPSVQLVVVGGAALTARGLRPATDIDLVVNEQTYSRLRNEGWQEETYRPTAGRPKRLLRGVFDVGTAWGKGSYRPENEYLFASAIEIDGIKCTPLTEVLQWKEQARRAKDLPDIARIRQTLGLSNERHVD